MASRLSPILRLDLVPSSRAQMFSLESHFVTQFSSPLPLLQAMGAMHMQDMPSWWGNSQGRKAAMSGNSSPYEIPNSTPCNERPPSVHRGYASTWSRRDCRRKGTAPAGSRACQHGGHPRVQEDGTTVTAALLRAQPPRQRIMDTHPLVSKRGESRGLQPPHQLLVISTKGSFISQDAQKR